MNTDQNLGFVTLPPTDFPHPTVMSTSKQFSERSPTLHHLSLSSARKLLLCLPSLKMGLLSLLLYHLPPCVLLIHFWTVPQTCSGVSIALHSTCCFCSFKSATPFLLCLMNLYPMSEVWDLHQVLLFSELSLNSLSRNGYSHLCSSTIPSSESLIFTWARRSWEITHACCFGGRCYAAEATWGGLT